MTIKELKTKMIAVQDDVAALINNLQDEDIDVTEVTVEKIEITCKNDHRPRYTFKVYIETKIRS